MNSKHSWETTCDHGECFGGKCIYAKEANTIESLRRQVAELQSSFEDEVTAREKAEAQVAELQGELQHQTYAYGIEFERAEKSETEYKKLQKATVYELQGYTEAARSVAALLDWERRCAIALGVPGCSPEEMLNVIDSQREDAERYRWFRSKRLWDADQFPWPKDFEYPEPCLWDDGEMLDAAIDAVRKV